MPKSALENLAIAVAVSCVRNTYLEDLHSGYSPRSKTGDYSDVKVVTPFGDIPWNELSRLNDREMKKLMKEVVNRIYTFLIQIEDPALMTKFGPVADLAMARWDKPELVKGFLGYGKSDRHF